MFNKFSIFNQNEKKQVLQPVSRKRNKKLPSDYLSLAPRDRQKEKLNIIYEWLLEFHYSTRQMLLQRLGLATHLHKKYFASLEEKGILKKTEVFQIKSKFIYMLTTSGERLALEKHGEKKEYLTGHKRIKHNALRHDLAVQNYVIKMLPDHECFIGERYIENFNLGYNKKPDACLCVGGIRRMLEVELTPKSVDRIYVALSTHARALSQGLYDEVIYVFPTKTLRNYYLKYFMMDEWPLLEKNGRGNWLRNPDFNLNIDQFGVREAFRFLVDETVAEGI